MNGYYGFYHDNLTRRGRLMIQQALNALQLGSIYALIALGYSMVYGVLRLINFAHGDIFMVGSYIALYFAVKLNLGAPLTVLATMAAAAFLGVLIERIAYRPLRSAPRVSAVITALGVGIFLETFTLAVVGPQPQAFPELLPKIIYKFDGIRTSSTQLTIILLSFVLMVALDQFVQRTRTGMAMRALSWDLHLVSLMGVDIDRIVSITFALGTSLAAVAGIFVGLAYPVIDPYMGIMVGWKAFIAAVVGGIGSVRGAMAGGYILGAIEILAVANLPSTYRDMIAFAILLFILLVKPSGFFGSPVSKKV
ncbi:MAG: branched-chain amino acid ABC transporter permease [Candidatus Riflebacteria bacterium]|nr:branched-chain amino acid ABC transporter permease [Candidatus Riflebacteria bacterium]